MTGSAAAVELRRGVGVAPVMVQVVQVAGREEDVAARASRRDHDRLARGPGSQIQSPFSDRALIQILNEVSPVPTPDVPSVLLLLDLKIRCFLLMVNIKFNLLILVPLESV